MNTEQKMYDKIVMEINRENFGVSDYNNIENLLNNPERTAYRDIDQNKVQGGFNGLKVIQRGRGLKIIGSLSGYYQPSNVYMISRARTEEAIKEISEIFKFKPEDAIISEIEFACTCSMNEEVSNYFPILGTMPRMKRTLFAQNETLYYSNQEQSKVIRLYDKGKEAKKKKYAIPTRFVDANLLRYELVFKKRLAEQLKVTEVKASTLYTENFYNLMKSKLQDTYMSINKKIKCKVDKQNVTSGEAKKMLYAFLAQHSGQDTDDIISMFDFANKVEKSKFKKELEKEFCRVVGTITNEALINELDEQVKNISDYP